MPELPKISGDEAIKVFKRLGFDEVRQRGSHVVLRRDNAGCVIPRHKSLAVGTLKSAIKQAGITDQEFLDSYKNKG
jgi:predicted RNA binding protein YcfA (HicA-like mRNA interferase family)